MTKWLCFILSLLILFPLKAEERTKVALLLCGGGANGVAHIGVMKVL